MSLPSVKPYWSFHVNAEIVRRPVGGWRRGRSCRHARQVAGMFGLHEGPSGGLRETLYAGLEFEVRPGQIVSVIGPSGAGKSVLLRCVERQARTVSRGGVVNLLSRELAECPLPAVEALPRAPLERRLEALSCCGLAEAGAMVTPAKFLSGGQLHRLALAGAILSAWSASPRAGNSIRPTLLIADEFAAVLDFATAEMLCMQLRKLLAGPAGEGLAIVLATPRAELLDALAPDLVIVKPLGEAAFVLRTGENYEGQASEQTVPARRVRDPRCWPIERGSIRDYRTLAGFHYIAGPPAAHKRVYVIRPPEELRRGNVRGREMFTPDVAAVLVVSPPVMCVRGRNVATAGRYIAPRGVSRELQRTERRERLRRLNDEVECISRVIVHPIYRGSGLAVRLVRHALSETRMPLMESLAAMGGVHPLFTRSGFTDFGAFDGADPSDWICRGNPGVAGRKTTGGKTNHRPGEPARNSGRKYHYFLAHTGRMLRPMSRSGAIGPEESLRQLRSAVAFLMLVDKLRVQNLNQAGR